MRVLVTGACGQLGYAVSQELAVRETEYLGLSARYRSSGGSKKTAVVQAERGN